MYMYSALYDDTFSDEPNRAHAILESKPVCKIGWNFTSFMPTIKRKSVKEDDTLRFYSCLYLKYTFTSRCRFMTPKQVSVT